MRYEAGSDNCPGFQGVLADEYKAITDHFRTFGQLGKHNNLLLCPTVLPVEEAGEWE